MIDVGSCLDLPLKTACKLLSYSSLQEFLELHDIWPGGGVLFSSCSSACCSHTQSYHCGPLEKVDPALVAIVNERAKRESRPKARMSEVSFLSYRSYKRH